MTDGPHPRVSRAAYLLGYAGLLPQVLAVALIALGGGEPKNIAGPLGVVIAGFYGASIFSFLGGIWWGFAMRRVEGQAALALVSIAPSLLALALLVGSVVGPYRLNGWGLVLLGTAIALTLIVDRYLVDVGDAPEGWMRLRIPLSLGLGGLTILAGLLSA